MTQLAELHAVRDDYHALLKGHLRLLEHYLTLTELHQQLFGANPIRIQELSEALGELRSLHDELFPRWQTLEDLQQLLIEKFSVPADQLRDLVAKHPPPPSWYDESDDPFSAG